MQNLGKVLLNKWTAAGQGEVSFLAFPNCEHFGKCTHMQQRCHPFQTLHPGTDSPFARLAQDQAFEEHKNSI